MSWKKIENFFLYKKLTKINLLHRSNHQRCSLKKEFFKNFTKFKGKHLCWSLFFNIDSGLRPATLLKKRLQQRCFPVNFVKFSRTPFFTEHFPTTSSFCNLSHSFILQRSFIHLFQPSFARKIEKNSLFCHLFILQIYFVRNTVNAFIL